MSPVFPVEGPQFSRLPGPERPESRIEPVLEIKQGKYDRDQLNEIWEEVSAKADEALEQSVLPETSQPDDAWRLYGMLISKALSNDPEYQAM